MARFCDQRESARRAHLFGLRFFRARILQATPTFAGNPNPHGFGESEPQSDHLPAATVFVKVTDEIARNRMITLPTLRRTSFDDPAQYRRASFVKSAFPWNPPAMIRLSQFILKIFKRTPQLSNRL